MIMVCAGVGCGGFFLMQILTTPVKTEKAESSPKEEAPEKKDEGSENKEDAPAKKEGDPKKVTIAPTLPRLKKHMQPIRERDYWSGNSRVTAPTYWSGQTSYGPPVDMHVRIFEDTMLAMPNDPTSSQKPTAHWQVSFGTYSTYNQAVQKKKQLMTKVAFALTIHTTVGKKGGPEYSVRSRAPFARDAADQCILDLLHRSDIVAHRSPYIRSG